MDKQKTRRFLLNKWIVLYILVAVIFAGMLIFIVSSLWYSRQCSLIYNQVTNCVGNYDIAMYGEYDGQIVEIARENRNPIWDSITDKMVVFTTADQMPAEQPVIVRFDDILKMEIYPTDSKDLFVKYEKGGTVKYYFVKNTSYFSYLLKMVSKDGWLAPNIVPD